MAALKSPTIDALAEMAHLTAEIISRAIFGKELGANMRMRLSTVSSAISAPSARWTFCRCSGCPTGCRAGTGRRASLGAAHSCGHRRRHRQLWLGRGPTSGAVIGRLLEARDPETDEKLTKAAVRNEAAVLFMAGHETTANSLAWTWYLLSQSPEVEAKLHEEVDSVLAGRAPTLADVPHLVYTRAVFEEVLRLYPPVPFLAREALVDADFKGTKIAKGSLVLAVPWLLHRHKKLWDRPDEFVPERFLPDGSGAPSKFAYIPSP